MLDLDDIFGGVSAPAAVTAPAPHSQQNMFGAPAAPPAFPQSQQQQQKPASDRDLLSDIFSSVTLAPTPAIPQNSLLQPQQPSGLGMSMGGAGDLLSLGGGGPMLTPAAATPMGLDFMSVAPSGPPQVKAFDKGGLQVILELSKPNPAVPANTRCLCKFSNLTPMPMTNFVFQVT